MRHIGVLLLSALAIAIPARAQQKTGPGITGDDSLTWHGITLYGVVDIGLQYDTHSAPFTPYRPAASGNIVRQNSGGSVTGLTPSNMGQSRVGPAGHRAAKRSIRRLFSRSRRFSIPSPEKSPIL